VAFCFVPGAGHDYQRGAGCTDTPSLVYVQFHPSPCIVGQFQDFKQLYYISIVHAVENIIFGGCCAKIERSEH
jgi:hypothetical protein